MNSMTSQAEFELLTELRTKDRISAFLVAFLEVDENAFPVRLRNLSTAGALVEAEAGFPNGKRVMFRRAFAAIPGRIVWARGGRFGIAFERELAEEDVVALSRRILPKSD